MASVTVGGIEGGASHSNAVILNNAGQILGRATGPGTNHHLIGMEECRRRIATMINQAKKEANISEDTPLDGLGLSLSGCELTETNNELVRGLKEKYPNLAKDIFCGSDTEGSVAATSNNGGIVCIAGTGSNTLLVNPDGSRAQCGGWGYILGDEGSAWSISLKAVKICFDEFDKFNTAPYPIDRVWKTIQDHFNIKIQPDLLDAFYGKFDKATISTLCKKLSVLANEGDLLAKHIFHQAGTDLGKSVSAVVPKASKELSERDGGVHILCVGSVWLSWNLLRPGFVDYLNTMTNIEEISLMKLTTVASVGAALLGADKAHLPISRDYSKNYDVFYRYKRGACSK